MSEIGFDVRTMTPPITKDRLGLLGPSGFAADQNQPHPMAMAVAIDDNLRSAVESKNSAMVAYYSTLRDQLQGDMKQFMRDMRATSAAAHAEIDALRVVITPFVDTYAEFHRHYRPNLPPP